LRAYDDQGKETSIRHDQTRRMDMIVQALDAYDQQHPQAAIAQITPIPKVSTHQPSRQNDNNNSEVNLASIRRPETTTKRSPDQIADSIIFAGMVN
jgi:hypothetical protein